MGLKTSVLSGLKWTVGVKFGTQLINWTFTIFVMRLLQPDDYDLLAIQGLIGKIYYEFFADSHIILKFFES